jgi:DNA-binding Lrp family transcriptional regulator
MKYLESLGWSEEEHLVLQKWLDFASNIGISEESVFLQLKKLNMDLSNIINWYEVILTKINEEIFKEALTIFREGNFYPNKEINRKFREYFQEILQENVYDWFPKINEEHIMFNNLLDRVIDDVSKKTTKDKLGKLLFDKICEEFERTYNVK